MNQTFNDILKGLENYSITVNEIDELVKGMRIGELTLKGIEWDKYEEFNYYNLPYNIDPTQYPIRLECNCGTWFLADIRDIIDGKFSNCGTCKFDFRKRRELESLPSYKGKVKYIGTKPNKMLVLKLDYDRCTIGSKSRTYFWTRCDCGKLKSVRSDGLKGTISCGCYNLEVITSGNRGDNINTVKYEGDLVYILNDTDNPVIMEREDYELVKRLRIDVVIQKRKNGKEIKYACIQKNDFRYFIHRTVLGIGPRDGFNDDSVDHLNKNTLDNRKCNIEPGTNLLNSKNFEEDWSDVENCPPPGCYKYDRSYNILIRVKDKMYNFGSYHNLNTALYILLKAKKVINGNKYLYPEIMIKYGVIKSVDELKPPIEFFEENRLKIFVYKLKVLGRSLDKRDFVGVQYHDTYKKWMTSIGGNKQTFYFKDKEEAIIKRLQLEYENYVSFYCQIPYMVHYGIINKPEELMMRDLEPKFE